MGSEMCIRDSSRVLPDARVEYVPGGHMGVITKSSEVMPHLAEWLNS